MLMEKLWFIYFDFYIKLYHVNINFPTLPFGGISILRHHRAAMNISVHV